MSRTESVVERLRWPAAEPLPPGPGPSRVVVARTFTYLYGAGGLLALATLLLPHGPGRSTLGVALPAIAALTVAFATAAFDRIPLVLFRWLPLVGTALATVVVASADPASTIPYTGFYFWVVLSAFYLFEARWAWVNVALVGIALALALLLSPRVGDRVVAWVMVMGALAVGGGIIGLLRARLETLARQSQRALEQTRESERALADAQRIAQVGSWDVDLSSGRFRGSAQLFRILGLDEGSVSSVDEVLDGLGQDGRDALAAAVRAGVAGDGRVDVEHAVELPTLGRRVLQTRAQVMRAGGRPVALVGTTQDVTERRAQEDELQRTLRRLRATIDIGLALGRDRDPGALIELISDRAKSLLNAEAVFIDRADGSEPVASGPAQYLQLRAPLDYHGVTHGVLVAQAPRGSNGFTAEDEEMLRAFATSAAAAVAGAEMVQEDALRRSIEAAERERRRFAHELHDQTLQGLAGLSMLLQAPAPDDGTAFEATRRIALTRLDQELENLRRIVADLRPAVLDELGLAPALEALAARVRHDHGLRVDTDIDLRPTALAGLDEAAEQTIYRVVQEGLTNVCRHAEATRARVVVRSGGDELTIRVEDDGRGFDPQRADGFGLLGMRERLALLGATLVVESRPGATVLDARVPLDGRAGPA